MIYLASVLGVAVLVGDRLTKLWAMRNLSGAIMVNDFLSFDLQLNRGVSFSLFAREDSFSFALLTSVIVLVTASLCWYTWKKMIQQEAVLGEVLVLAGSVSNLVDRFLYGGVVDFIACGYKHYSFPVFNCADIGIVCGVLLMIYSLFGSRHE